MSGHCALRALLAMVLSATVIGVLPSSLPASAAPGDEALTDSAVMLPGQGEFADLKVTVSQTNNLINQTITVSWTGGRPTPFTGYYSNFLQIMQCWGDDPGPDRTQCQFGGGADPKASTGNWTRSRQIDYGGFPVDPNEKLVAPGTGELYLPFWPVGEPKPTSAVTSPRNDYFNSQVTNEIPLARTRGDGTGLEHFEVQTVREAAGLGCGAPVTTGGATGRKCWLVVVPRGTEEVDGSPGGDSLSSSLNSSPLSQSNWDNRIVFPLEFLPVGQPCPLGAAERRVVGHELPVDAISRWQPALCAGGGALYSYTQLSDGVIRNQVLEGSSPGLALMTDPIPPDQAPPDRALVYAPVGLSGLSIAFNIEHQPVATAPPEQLQLSGLRFTSMKLTPRLVAKLLTQSYREAVAGYPEKTPGYLQNNPLGLTRDPEFLELNTDYAGFAQYATPPNALVELGGSDLTSLLWSWVKADADASAFLAGTPDKYGMVVNPNNQGLTLPMPTFPRNDQNCADINVGAVTGRSCTLDIHPFTNDMHHAGLSLSRGDSLGRVPSGELSEDGIPILKAVDRQSPGARALMAVVDSATAQRHGLPTAELRNAAGQFIAPTTESLLAGVAAMKPGAVAGVRVSDPGATDPAAYPLTALSYAVASPSTLDVAAGREYAAFLRYAAGPGQQPGVGPGQLPFGMAPLPDELRAQTTAAAATIEAEAGKTAPDPPTNPEAVPGTETRGSDGSTDAPSAPVDTGGAATNPGGGAGTPPDGAAQAPGGSATNAPGVTQRPVAGSRLTPALPAPAVGGLLVAILICGALAATSSPVMHWLGAAVQRRTQKGVTPTNR